MVSHGAVTPELVALTDTACTRSVVCVEQAEAAQQWCLEKGWPFEVVEDQFSFEFGPEEPIWSFAAMIMVVQWGGQVMAIRFSIIEGDVPFLVSKSVLKQMGSSIDLVDAEVTFKRLGKAVEPLIELRTGHIGLPLGRDSNGAKVLFHNQTSGESLVFPLFSLRISSYLVKLLFPLPES